MNKENHLKIKPAIILNIGSVKYKSNIPAGYCMVVDTPRQVPYKLAGTPHSLSLDYSMAKVDVKLKY